MIANHEQTRRMTLVVSWIGLWWNIDKHFINQTALFRCLNPVHDVFPDLQLPDIISESLESFLSCSTV